MDLDLIYKILQTWNVLIEGFKMFYGFYIPGASYLVSMIIKGLILVSIIILFLYIIKTSSNIFIRILIFLGTIVLTILLLYLIFIFVI